MSSSPANAPTNRVRSVLDELGVVVFPGVFDTLSAITAQRCGFPLAFISGYSVAATTIGEPDLGLLTQMEMIDRARQVCGQTENIGFHRGGLDGACRGSSEG